MNSTYNFETPEAIRLGGYNEEFILESYKRAVRLGCVLDAGLDNPNPSNVTYLQDKLGIDFEMNERFFQTALVKWLPQLNRNQQVSLAKAMLVVFEQLLDAGKFESALRGFYVKLMCWLNTKFMKVLPHISSSAHPVVLYCGEYDTYRLRALQVLHLCGCTVVYIDKSCDEVLYKKCDCDNHCTHLLQFETKQQFPFDWSLACIQTIIAQRTSRARIVKPYGASVPIVLDDKPDFENLGEVPCRLYVSGVCNDYTNLLFEYKTSAMCIVGELPPASPDEIPTNKRDFPDVLMCASYLVKDVRLATIDLSKAFQRSFVETVDSVSMLSIQKCISYFCLCMRFKDILNKGRVLWLHPTESAATKFVLDFLSRFAIQIIVLDPGKSGAPISGYYVQEYSDAANITAFPEHRIAEVVTTTASRAEAQIRDVLYSDGELGIFQDNQYSRAKSVYLNCTLDEINILWNQELRFRSGFEIDDGEVQMPTIFAAIHGILNGDLKEYNAMLRELKKNAVVVYGELLTDALPEVFAAECMKHTRIDFDRVMQHRTYRYAHLRKSVQMHILYAAQRMIDSNIIKDFGKRGIENTVMQVVLGLPTMFLNAIQNFDFTKRNPKLVWFRLDQQQLSLKDTVLTHFLSQIGFDVVFVIPTGYNVLNNYATRETYKSFDLSNYKYDFDPTLVDKVSVLDKLFKRR